MNASRPLWPPLAQIEHALFTPQDPMRSETIPSMPAPDTPTCEPPLPPAWLAELITRRVAANALAERPLPRVGQIVRVGRATDAEGRALTFGRPLAVLLDQPVETFTLWYGWLCSPDTDWACCWDLLLEPGDEPFDPLAGMVQLWNPVYVRPIDCDRVLAELRLERLAAVRALARDFVIGDAPATPSQPGTIETRTLAGGHSVLTGTPLGAAHDPRQTYQAIYHHVAEVALRASARATLAAIVTTPASPRPRQHEPLWARLMESFEAAFGTRVRRVSDVAHPMSAGTPDLQELRIRVDDGLSLHLLPDDGLLRLELRCSAGHWQLERFEDDAAMEIYTLDTTLLPPPLWLPPEARHRLLLHDLDGGRDYNIALPGFTADELNGA